MTQTKRQPSTSVPVTILTGYLGSGKTTLVNHILTSHHGERIAVIENEFGEEGIDNDLLFQDRDEQIIEMNNGCICCTVRGDLVRILSDLADKRARQEVRFERVIIETTGLADPAPVAQTFFIEDNIRNHYRLDAIITTVDAKHAQAQLTEHHEAQEQVGFADRLLITKPDLVSAQELQLLRARLSSMNARASILEVENGVTVLDDILDINGFNLNAILEMEPDFMNDVSHDHDDSISSFVFSEKRPLHAERLEVVLSQLVEHYGTILLRYKGVLNVGGMSHRVIVQGVHMLVGSVAGSPWGKNETPESRFVFIGRDIPKQKIMTMLQSCVID